MPLCDDGLRIAEHLLDFADANALRRPRGLTEAETAVGVGFNEALQDHATGCETCAPIIARAFFDGLRAAVAAPRP